jgi:hypothetical protein
VPHLLFADDTLLFCEPSVEQFRNMRCLLLCFEVVLGMKINLSKSEIVPVGDVEGLASILGCGVVSLPIKYLGQIWRMAPLCLMWCIWRERNARCFEDCEMGLSNLKRKMLQLLYMWRDRIKTIHDCSYFDFLDSCSLSPVP